MYYSEAGNFAKVKERSSPGLFCLRTVMKDLVVLVLVVIILFFIWNGRQANASSYEVGDVTLDAPVPPVIVQAIIEKVQSMKPDFEPIDTVFVNIQPDGSYKSRMMFFNTKHFFGSQFDINAKVNADGSVSILNIGDTNTVEASAGYKPGEYQVWTDVQTNLDTQFQGALQGYKNQPTQPNLSSIPAAYKQNMIVTQTNLQTRE